MRLMLKLRPRQWVGAVLFVGPLLFPWKLIAGYEPFGLIDFAAVPFMALGFVLLFPKGTDALLALLALSLGCSTPERPPRVYTRGAPPLSAPQMPEPAPPAARPEPELAKALVQIGRDQVVLEQQLAEAYGAAVFIQCLERVTGAKMDGKRMARQIRHNTSAARTCRDEYKGLSDAEIAAQAIAWVEDQP